MRSAAIGFAFPPCRAAASGGVARRLGTCRSCVRRPGVRSPRLEHGAHAKSRKDLVFGAVHGSVSADSSIVVPAQVQQPVQGVEKQLSFQRKLAIFRPPPGFRDADDDFARNGATARVEVEREGEHVGRPRQVHKPQVQFRHPPVADKRDGQIAQRGPQNSVCGTEMSGEVRNVDCADFGADRQ